MYHHHQEFTKFLVGFFMLSQLMLPKTLEVGIRSIFKKKWFQEIK